MDKVYDLYGADLCLIPGTLKVSGVTPEHRIRSKLGEAQKYKNQTQDIWLKDLPN